MRALTGLSRSHHKLLRSDLESSVDTEGQIVIHSDSHTFRETDVAGHAHSSTSRRPAPSSIRRLELAAQHAASTGSAILDGRTVVDVLGLNERIGALAMCPKPAEEGDSHEYLPSPLHHSPPQN
jgi:hypothetical protein